MCGIVGCLSKTNALQPVISGLKNLEYRGYDSAGVAYGDKTLKCIKQAGRVEVLQNEIPTQDIKPSKIAIGHTRWATHGPPTITNAHPHFNADKTIFVIHNGIIENHHSIRATLQAQGYKFISQTDTEVIPHLIDYYYRQTKNINKAFELAVQDLDGAYAIVMISTIKPGTIFGAKLSSPLAIGIGKTAIMIGSDSLAVADVAKKIVYLEDYETVTVTPGGYKIKNFKRNKTVNRQPEHLQIENQAISKGDFKHFMIKEIFDAPKTVQSAMLGRLKLELNSVKLGGLEQVEDQLACVNRFLIVACGTSYYAGLVGEYLLEEIAGIPVEVQLASEFKYRSEPLSSKTVMLAISQSGETADTIAALKKVEGQGILRLGIVNSPGSTVSRITDAGVYCHAGPEISVASTKAFMAQVTVLALIALKLGKGKAAAYSSLLKELAKIPHKLELVLAQADRIKAIAKQYANFRDFLFIGRGYEYPVALEGALKLKEVSYIHAEGYAAGEMKHGPLAMIDKNFPTFALAASANLSSKIISNIQEIKARGGKVIVVAPKKYQKKLAGLANDIIEVPPTLEQLTPLIEAVVIQLFAYYVALHKKLDIDKPRNLAKSVTVE